MLVLRSYHGRMYGAGVRGAHLAAVHGFLEEEEGDMDGCER